VTSPNRVRLGAVEYLNARPLVYGLDGSPRFDLRFDVPSRCAALLHEGHIDVGLIPSIEYVRGHEHARYAIVPGMAIASRGSVASVAIYTSTPIDQVRSLALDTSSRTSVALARVLCAKVFGIRPAFEPQAPDLERMLSVADAALIIGDNALFLDPPAVQKIDLGEVWTKTTGLPFVYAFWAGRPGVLTPADVRTLQDAKTAGVERSAEVAAAYYAGSPERQAVGARYLRDNIKYDFGPDERAGLELFYRYAEETGVIERSDVLRFYEGR
jgi:chorismate dehydratase